MQTIQFWFLVVLFLTFSACSSEEEFTGYRGVDLRLWEYFESFEEEAELRGFAVDLRASGITARVNPIPENGVAGLCRYNPAAHNSIEIDESFWNNSSLLFREFVVFHELGHCFLNRDHIEDSFLNGLCVSIMRSGVGDCRDNYNSNNRSDYLDELFFE